MQNNIQRVPISQFDAYAADLWLLAPPCQPYTRQGLKKGSQDARAESFLSLLDRCTYVPFARASASLPCLLTGNADDFLLR